MCLSAHPPSLASPLTRENAGEPPSRTATPAAGQYPAADMRAEQQQGGACVIHSPFQQQFLSPSLSSIFFSSSRRLFWIFSARNSRGRRESRQEGQVSRAKKDRPAESQLARYKATSPKSTHPSMDPSISSIIHRRRNRKVSTLYLFPEAVIALLLTPTRLRLVCSVRLLERRGAGEPGRREPGPRCCYRWLHAARCVLRPADRAVRYICAALAARQSVYLRRRFACFGVLVLGHARMPRHLGTVGACAFDRATYAGYLYRAVLGLIVGSCLGILD
ncbi:hypothetical protein IWZ01DRAFT_16945 [Phyllosticta capitalensis]